MGRIRVLDDALINRIAAGEVVERPASVLKELVENSLDAGARRIEIALSAGGRKLIRVADDGEGMDRDDALLALERHATSKLRSRDDLEAIGTLGFRGEALPAIAAVSRFLLRTASADGAGVEIEVRGGRIHGVRECSAARGTTIEVASLFFNTPARRKFLRSEPTELAHALKLITRLALTAPGVRFHLEHDGRALLDAPAASDARDRFAQLFGDATAASALPFALVRDGIAVSGFAGRPADAGSRRDAQHLFVNGRVVQDRVLAHAVAEAYGNTVARDRAPATVVFVTIDPRSVDVNVHPQKTEVRFARSGEVHDAVRAAVASALPVERAIPSYAQLRAAPGATTAAIAEAALGYLDRRERPAQEHVRPFVAPAPAQPALPAPRTATLDHAAPPPDRALPLAQFRDSYIVAEDGNGLLLVDQHAAHERVLFERFLEEAERGAVEVQRLLFPVTAELAPHECVLLEAETGELARLGFMVEGFGGNSVRIDGIPAVAAGVDPITLLRALLGDAARVRSAAAGVSELRRKLVTTAACHAAIKVHHPLTREGMQGLLDDLSRTQNPSTCPHGRPTVFRLSLEEIERTFRRR